MESGSSPSAGMAEAQPNVRDLRSLSKYFDSLVDLVPPQFYHDSQHEHVNLKYLKKSERAAVKRKFKEDYKKNKRAKLDPEQEQTSLQLQRAQQQQQQQQQRELEEAGAEDPVSENEAAHHSAASLPLHSGQAGHIMKLAPEGTPHAGQTCIAHFPQCCSLGFTIAAQCRCLSWPDIIQFFSLIASRWQASQANPSLVQVNGHQWMHYEKGCISEYRWNPKLILCCIVSHCLFVSRPCPEDMLPGMACITWLHLASRDLQPSYCMSCVQICPTCDMALGPGE